MLRDPVRGASVLRAEPWAYRHSVHLHRAGVAPRVCSLTPFPELIEREREGVRDLGRAHGHDDVLLPGPESSVQLVDPVKRRAVADDVLVVHEVEDSRDSARLDREPLDRIRRRLGWRRDRDRPWVSHVVEEADRDSALYRGQERGQDETAGIGFEADVVNREIEALRRLGEELGEEARDVGGALAPVGERRDPLCRAAPLRVGSRSLARSERGLVGALRRPSSLPCTPK